MVSVGMIVETRTEARVVMRMMAIGTVQSRGTVVSVVHQVHVG